VVYPVVHVKIETVANRTVKRALSDFQPTINCPMYIDIE